HPRRLARRRRRRRCGRARRGGPASSTMDDRRSGDRRDGARRDPPRSFPVSRPLSHPEATPRFEVIAITGIGHVRPGDDLAAAIAEAAPWLADGDILVVTSKIISKAEGQLVDVPVDGPERDAARETVLAAETARPVARRGPVRIVQTHHGFVMASAGIDASNVDAAQLVLLPKDPDASARSLRAALRERFGLDVAVVVTDTMGRPWRLGLTDVAIGAAGIEALTDYRGTLDSYGNELSITQMAVIDELAAAAELVKGKSDQVPVAVVRGLGVHTDAPDGDGAAILVRRADEDLFSLGTAEARSLGLRDAADLPDATTFAPGPADVDELLHTAGLGEFARDAGDRGRTPTPHAAGLGDFARGAGDREPTPTPDIAGLGEGALAGGGSAGATPFRRVVEAGELDRVGADLPANTALVLAIAAPSGDARAIARTGAEVQRLRARLAAEGLASAWLDADPSGEVADLGGVPLGVLAVGLP